MDGNRRYADKNHLLKSVGHAHGFNKLMQTLEWCKHIGVTEATVYAFSIENFNRSEEEVNALMTLAREKFNELLSEKNDLEKNGVCVRFFGSLHLLPKDIQILMAKLVLETRHNNKAYFNVCIAYTSRQEITEAMNKITDAVTSNSISVE
ncbi:dehydrodolichyl diphosphate syntase complex subunit DHDDS-like protein [Leptotrombidium deliense]|uniref:Alkyl transferase n=1 Tax=Leptotrombidium deliense TaxID=299467 RepID=A0A443RT44_9ACAR|nr:dehydrodolichyl diphosphate syntase complex subunit DHDDS-like protein [Leptotrombidium deliense]